MRRNDYNCYYFFAPVARRLPPSLDDSNECTECSLRRTRYASNRDRNVTVIIATVLFENSISTLKSRPRNGQIKMSGTGPTGATHRACYTTRAPMTDLYRRLDNYGDGSLRGQPEVLQGLGHNHLLFCHSCFFVLLLTFLGIVRV